MVHSPSEQRDALTREVQTAVEELVLITIVRLAIFREHSLPSHHDSSLLRTKNPKLIPLISFDTIKYKCSHKLILIAIGGHDKA
jgi:hypothetical protein